MRRLSDAIFALQLAATGGFCLSSALRACEDVRGVALSAHLGLLIFLVLNLFLVTTARKRGWEVQKATIGYVWSLLSIGTVITTIAVSGRYTWSQDDSVCATTVVTMMAAVACCKMQRATRMGTLAVVCRGFPQLFLMARMLQEGAGGIPLAALLAQHVINCARIAQLCIAARDKDANIRAAMLAEVAVEILWIATSVVWIGVQG